MKHQKAQLPVADSLPSEWLRTPGHCLGLAQGCCHNALLVLSWALGEDLPHHIPATNVVAVTGDQGN